MCVCRVRRLLEKLLQGSPAEEGPKLRLLLTLSCLSGQGSQSSGLPGKVRVCRDSCLLCCRGLGTNHRRSAVLG